MPVAMAPMFQVMFKFLINYPLGEKLIKNLEFYLRQLQFEHESGRDSALEMIATVFNTEYFRVSKFKMLDAIFITVIYRWQCTSLTNMF